MGNLCTKAKRKPSNVNGVDVKVAKPRKLKKNARFWRSLGCCVKQNSDQDEHG